MWIPGRCSDRSEGPPPRFLVGGYAVAFHAQPRFTTGLDVWTDPDPVNATLVFEALRRFGAPLHELTATDLGRPGTIFQMGVPPNRIDN